MDPSTHPHPIVTGTGHKNSFNVTNSYNTTYVDENPQIIEWLSPLEPRFRHQDVRTRRLDGLGDWFLQTDGFVNWRDGRDGSSPATLFCSGAPGAGKTYLSSLVIDELCDRAVDRGIAVACFYCDFQSQKMQTPENVLGALVKQLMPGSGPIPTEIGEAFRKAKDQVGGRGLRVPEALELLKAAVAPLKRAFLCIDALDECLGKYLPKLLRSLHAISRSCPGVRFFFTGRPHIEGEIEKHFPGSVQSLQIKPRREDIMRYVEMMLDEDSDSRAMNPELQAEIMNRVSETISDVFLLVSLNVAAILGEPTIHQRREQLKRMTNGRGLGDAYRVTLDRMRAQSAGKSRLGMAALMWISRSERPMRSDELCHALGVQIGSTEPNPDNIPSIQTVLASCLGLVTIDGEETTFRLVHFTLQEYLDSRSDLFQHSYAAMAEVCLAYLGFGCIRKIPPTLAGAPQEYPFLEYASRHWGHYARNETTESVKSLALQLLGEFDSHISAKLLLRPHVWKLMLGVARQAKGFTGLHCVAYLGIDEIAAGLLDMKDWDVDKTDFEGCTPLIRASQNGCEGAVRLLIEQAGANPDFKDTSQGKTPLAWAAKKRQEGIVKLLLERDEVDPESRDDNGLTPLSHAASAGSEGSIKLLLEREDVDPGSRGFHGRTPLTMAAWSGEEGAVKLLLERKEVNPDSRDDFDRTPLSYAAWCGREGVVKLLLEREEVNLESRDRDGRTPLSWAASSTEDEVVKLLLDREEVNPESRDNGGLTPLTWAAYCGTAETVKLLLEREEVNPESRDNNGQTPLSWATWFGHVAVMKLLLERDEVNPESRDNYGRTPLSWASQRGRKGAVKLLLESDEVNPESQDSGDRTPLSFAAEHGAAKAVKLLLGREEVNPESRDSNGRSPLSWAARYGREGVVKLLLERGEVNPESRDTGGRTPLSWAAWHGTVEIVKLLLEREEVNPESRDSNGRTPLAWAAWSREGAAVKLLLEREEVDPESRGNDGRSPLSRAVQWGNERTIELLLEREEVNPESRDNDGLTPLWWASFYSNKDAVKLLLERTGVSPKSPNNRGYTSSSHAQGQQ